MGSIPGPVQWVKGSSFAPSVTQVMAATKIQSLAQELPYLAGAAIKKKKKKKSLVTDHHNNIIIMKKSEIL